MRSIDWETATHVLAAHESIIAAWAFGSAQKGQLGPESDLDIGVLFRDTPSFEEWASLRASLQQALQFEEVDLVTLNEANPILRFEAVSGRSIFCRDTGHRAAFVSLAAREYEDEIGWVQHGMNRQKRAV
jgi:predicted nucleotidyltransferase